MSNDETCIPCESLDRKHIIPASELPSKVADTLPLWTVVVKTTPESSSFSVIRRSFTCKNFQAAMDFIQQAGEVCETESHHADFHLTSYRDVALEFYTHSVGGVTVNDLTVAAKLDKIKPQLSPKWARENGLA